MSPPAKSAVDPYNKLLFEGNWLRRLLHTRRFRWMESRLRHLNGRSVSVVEIGCHDAKTITYIESAGLYVRRYVGFDANPLVVAAARERWKDRNSIEILPAADPADLGLEAGGFDIGVCMETLEHLPDAAVDGYLRALSQAVTGMAFITVPIERGAILLAKQIGYRAFNMYGERLAMRDLVNGVLGRMDRIQRHEHKGFDERKMIDRVAQYFDIVEARGLFVPVLRTMNFTFGIIGEARGIKRANADTLR